MNKIILVIVVLILAGGGYFVLKDAPDNYSVNKMLPQKTPTDTTVDTKTNHQKTDGLLMSQGTYIDYNEEEFAKQALQNGQRLVLFFYASWCPTCRPADAEFKANLNKIPQNVTLFKVNYDTETELKKKYGITYQHTFVQVDAQGNEITKWNGGSVDELNKNLK